MVTHICVSNPDHAPLSVDGKLVYSGGSKDIGQGLSSIADPACDDLDTDFSPDDVLSPLEFEVSAITNWSYASPDASSEKPKCAEVAETQRILDQWNTGIRVSCQKNGMFDQWLTNVDYMPPGMTDDEADAWLNSADTLAFDRVYVTHGTWNFPISATGIDVLPKLTLLPPGQASPLQQALDLYASNLRRQVQEMTVDVCLRTPVKKNWQVWDAAMQYGDGELKTFSAVGRPTYDQCQELDFELPHGTAPSAVQLRIFEITFPPDVASDSCFQYLQSVQSALIARFPGFLARCAYGDGWWLVPVIKPVWMSRFDAVWLLESAELYTVKGNWSFNLQVEP